MKLKLVFLATLAGSFCANASEAQIPEESPRPAPAIYDVDKDGTLNRTERQAYLDDVRQQHRETLRARATKRPALTPAMKALIEPQVWTAEKKQKYDLNHNGIIEPHESGRERVDAMKAARDKLAKRDLDGNGRLDQEEREGTVRPPSADVPATPGK